jgi:hypothetical protein
MDRIPKRFACVLATVLAIVASLAVGPARKATASPAATGTFRVWSILVVDRSIWSAAVRAAPL